VAFAGLDVCRETLIIEPLVGEHLVRPE